MTATASPPTEQVYIGTDSAPNDWQPELHEIPIKAIELGRNVRTTPIAGTLDELAASIMVHGIQSPVRVRETGAGAYELVYGQRRLMAAHLAGLLSVPAIVDPPGNERWAVTRIAAQLVENLQREDLNPIDTATAYRALLDTGLSQRELGKQLGLAQPTIANALRLLKAPDEIRSKVSSGELSATHAQAIAKLSDAEQTEIGRRIVEHKLTTRQVEEEIGLATGRTDEERQRAEKRKNEAAKRFDRIVELLTKKKADPERDTLLSFPGTAGDVLELLAKLGWKVRLDSMGATPAKGICDCTAFAVSFRYEWPGGQQVEKPSVTKACISSKHQAAAEAAEGAAYAAEQEEARQARLKAAEERAAAMAPLSSALATPIPPQKAKLMLYALVEGERWGAATRLVERLTGAPAGYIQILPAAWKAIDGLSHEQLLIEISGRVAEVAFDADGDVRAAVQALAAKKAKA